MKIGSKELIRDINTNLVLETIIEKAPISRAALSKNLGLTKATISSIVQELISKNLVIEIGSGDTTVGRKPTMLTLNKEAGNTICIDLDVTKINFMITDIGGSPLYRETLELEEGYEKNVISILIDLIERTSSKLPSAVYGFVGITIGIHGVIYNNSIVFTPYYDLNGIHLAEELEKQYHIPVFLFNESNLAVMGENVFLEKVENIASIGVHTGIGLGMVFNNKLYTGFNGYAGEFGHTIIELDGRQCPCGNKGCLEQYASQRVLFKELAEKKGLDKITFEEFQILYRKQDKDALDTVHQFVKIMAAAINNLLNLYNPEVILLNSQFTTEFPTILDEIKILLQPRMKVANSLRLSKMNDEAILYGAAYINIINFLKIKHFYPQVTF